MSKLKDKYSDDLIDISEIPRGTILRDWPDEGIRIIILRSNFSMNVYLGVPVDHPLAGFAYDDLPVECHGGLTYAAEGDGEYLPEHYYWYGYDYSHSGDYCWYESSIPPSFEGDHKWSLKEIVSDSWPAIYNFKQLAKLAEKIKAES